MNASVFFTSAIKYFVIFCSGEEVQLFVLRRRSVNPNNFHLRDSSQVVRRILYILEGLQIYMYIT